MRRWGVVFLAVSALASIAPVPSWAQSVISTHSGLVYFFDGTVSLGNQRLEQRFGRFPDIGEGGELRTERGRAEVLLTPGVFLRVGENSSIRLLSNKLSDTRVEFLGGTAILEANEPAKNTAVTVTHKQWQIRLPGEGVYRIDSQPAQVIVFKGKAEVSAGAGPESVAVRVGETLPLASVLVPEQTLNAATDDFKSWAMGRSQAVSSDNATAAGIMDDPNAIENSTSAFAGLGGLGGLSYFPLTGIPGVAITNPYGSSFWSPFQSTLSSIYFPSYLYGSLYPAGWPTIIQPHFWRTPGVINPLGGIGRVVRSGGLGSPRPPYSPPLRPSGTSGTRTLGTAPVHAAPHAIHHR